MTFVPNVGLPLLVAFVMTVAGLELGPADFINLHRYPGVVTLTLCGQWVLLPLALVLSRTAQTSAA
jgi:predicted Na+-dependent transporter